MTTVGPILEPSVSHSRLRLGLGTFVAIEAEARADAVALAGIEAAFGAILTVQRLMHPLRGTDLAAIAQGPLGMPMKVHRWTWDVLALCKRLHRASRGIFDPCLAGAPGRMADLQLLPADTLIAHAPLRIDLGGIAKGYAVDRAIEALRAAGCDAGLVNAGGDLAVFGKRSHSIVCGSTHATGIVVELHDAALATSDASCSESLAARRPAEHRGYYDGRGGRTMISGKATVIAAQAAIADGLTKCLLAAPRELGAAMLESFGAKQVTC
jgi:thiamine biosynthesis lipoprotein